MSVSGGLAGEDVPAKLLHGPVTREIKGRPHPVSEDRSSRGPHAPVGRPALGVGVAYPRGPCLSPRRPGPSPHLGEESEDVAAAHLVLTLHSGSRGGGDDGDPAGRAFNGGLRLQRGPQGAGGWRGRGPRQRLTVSRSSRLLA